MALAGVSLVVSLLVPRAASAQVPSASFPVVNGSVSGQLVYGGTIYIGGGFTAIGAPTGGGVLVDSVSALVVPGLPFVSGQVNAVAGDGTGGWYIGGLFSSVGGLPRTNLAHVLADHSVSPWNPGADGQVLCLANAGGVLYAGGAFGNAGGALRARLAAIDTSTALATSWNPGANDLVRTVLARGAVVYVGGRFSFAGGTSRGRIAAFDSSSGATLGWNPNATFDVYALAESAGTVYAGGAFSAIGGSVRSRLAALDSITGAATPWNPGATGQVNALALAGGTLYVGGAFGGVGGQQRSRIAAVDAASGTVTAWNPGADQAVSSLAVSGGTVYAGGDFQTIGGRSRSRLAAIDAITATTSAWNPVAYGSVLALGVDGGGAVFAGGSFGGMGGSMRSGLAAIDATTGAVTSWDPEVSGQVLIMERHGGILYVGGLFTSVGGQARSNLAALDLQSGSVRPWNPIADDQVTAIAANDSMVYVGGLFTTIAGQARSAIAQLTASSGEATAWDASADNQVWIIRDGGDVVYAGGSFATIGNADRNCLAAIDVHTGVATSWAPESNGTVRDMLLNCGTLYVAGFFSTIGSNSRSRIAAVDVASGSATAWNPGANGPVYDMTLANGVLYTGGIFTSIGGQARNRLAALDPTTGVATTWNPNCNGTVFALAASGTQVSAGGSFSSVGGKPVSNLVGLPADGSFGCGSIALAPGTLPDGVVGTPYSASIAASGGAGAYCYAVTDGSLPAGLALSAASGAISGTPLVAIAASFTVTATDARGCTGSRVCALSVFGGSAAGTLAADARGLCINGSHPFVAVPVVYTRPDSAPARLVSVTFQLQSPRLALRTPLTPGASVHLGSWFDAFPNGSVQVTDNGGGSYTADAILLGQPCGQTHGGTLLQVDVASGGPDGRGAISITSAHARDCSNVPIAVGPGPVDSVRIQLTPLVVSPASLATANAGTAYHQAFSTALGTPPYAFAITAGALPPGLALSSAGSLDGTPAAGGSFAFTVGVTDSIGCTGSRAYTLQVDCAPISVATTLAPDALLDSLYAAAFAASGGVPPLTWSVGPGALPDGLSLAASTGQVSGTPTATGTSTFTLTVTDANGCTANRVYAMTVFAGPVATSVAAHGDGICLSTHHPVAAVPLALARTDTAAVRRVIVTFRADTTRLALATPLAPDSSLHLGTWFSGYPAPTISVTSAGGGAYTADLAIPGAPCGPTGGGTLFTLDVTASGADGPASVQVLAVRLLGCSGDTLPVVPGTAGPLLVNRSAPAPVSALAAAPIATGNGSGGTTGISLTWSGGAGGIVTLYRAPWASYPLYAAGAPPDSSLAPGGPWTLVASGVASPLVDPPGVRGFWYYVALVSDSCGNTSVPSNRTAGTLDYVLGDVSDGATPGSGNNRVGLEDITLLGANYGASGGSLASRGVRYLDVGPTTDGQLASRPAPDGVLDFEDLMVFAGNFQRSAAAPAFAGPGTRPASALPGPERFRLDAPSLVTAGDEVVATVHLTAAGRMQGFAVTLAWNPLVLEPAAPMRSGGWIEGQGGLALTPGAGRVDAALLGRRGVGIAGEGDVATFHFRALRTGDAALRFGSIAARDAANRPLAAADLERTDALAPPAETTLLSPAPNPFSRSVALVIALAQPGEAELVVFDVNGRRVRTLASGPRAAGVHHLAWDGLDDGHSAVAQGVYYVRFTAGTRRQTTRVVHLR